MLVVMGGPMGTRDVQHYPWLAAEKRFLGLAAAGRPVMLGICLGAQLLAEVYGAAVYPNREKEIGWFEVSPAATAPAWFTAMVPGPMPLFHWHGDTFDIPRQALRLGSSAACLNQGFVLNDRIVGLQFHPEITASGIDALVANCRAELVPGPWIQTEKQITGGRRNIGPANRFMHRLLDYCAQQAV